MKFNRRRFLQLAGGAGSSLWLNGCRLLPRKKECQAHVVVIGGGFAGATAAKYIRELDSAIKVTLIEPKSQYISCPGSNWVLAGLRDMASITFSYEALAKRYGITLITDWVTAIDVEQHTVRLGKQNTIRYDRLIMAPGIDFRWHDVSGYDAKTAEYIPHAWQAGQQTLILRRQVQSLPDGGVIVISAPANPYRCPPGPYERASMLAYFLQQHKPKSKVIIIDHKRTFSKQALFIQGWKRNYGYGTQQSLIEWHSIADNPVVALDGRNKTLQTDFGDIIKADVLNLIPAQKAGKIAWQTGLTDETGWCPVNSRTSESILQSDIHVIGDAAIQQPIPKSAFAANSEAKVCAFAIVSLINERELLDPVWMNTCYSLLTPEEAISVAMVYRLNSQGEIAKVVGAGGVSSKTDQQSLHKEAGYARQVFGSITRDTFS